MRILIVEDDRHLAAEVKSGLEDSGYSVDLVADGETGVEMTRVYPYDLIVLDIMLPRKDGFSVCKDIRARGIKAPILMLTARWREDDRVRGLDCGADDYLVKPFSYPELYARIRALLRRYSGQTSDDINVGELNLSMAHRKAAYRGHELELTAKEYSILEYLALNHDGVVTREMLEEHVWDCESGALSNVIEVLVSRIRKKLDPGNTEAVIITVKGLGYTIRNEKP